MYEDLGVEWAESEIYEFTDHIERLTPSQCNEKYRYLSRAVTSIPGPMSYSVNPMMREIVDCADINSPVREVNVKKGVQISWTTSVLEAMILYYMVEVSTVPMMYMSADAELAKGRVSGPIMGMIIDSGFSYLIQSHDTSSKKTGKTEKKIEWVGGGSLIPFGAINANKMRDKSILIMMKDELDGWKDLVGKDGDPDKLSDDRCKGQWESRKIFRGSTPLIKGSSKIDKQYKRGDQRKYNVNCKRCKVAQHLVWKGEDETGKTWGIKWEMDGGTLIKKSVCYVCKNCGCKHYEHDKERLFDPKNGAKWIPTAEPVQPDIRSYHVPALYSPISMAPWSSLVVDWLNAWDVEKNVVLDIGLLQIFYNNVLAEPFSIEGSKISFEAVSFHRRTDYPEFIWGLVPNKFAVEYCESKILFLTCQVDVHKRFLSVGVFGWTRHTRCFVVDYFEIHCEGEHDYCTELSSTVWRKLKEHIITEPKDEQGDPVEKERVYKDEDGRQYEIMLTLIDSGYANDTVINFCALFHAGVYPIVGAARPAYGAKIKEFDIFHTQLNTFGYRIIVDHYKDRLAPVLRREWLPEYGKQSRYHFNAPACISNDQLTELTVETRKKKTDERGNDSWVWVRPSGARNELWDLLVYGHAAVDIIAYKICIEDFELETVDWNEFWQYMENQLELRS